MIGHDNKYVTKQFKFLQQEHKLNMLQNNLIYIPVESSWWSFQKKKKKLKKN